jgi:hypothetical protein
MSAWTAPERAETPRTPGERASLESWLEFHRATLLGKCAGLQPEQLVIRSCPPSGLSLLGLIRHMTDVETWFHGYDLQPQRTAIAQRNRLTPTLTIWIRPALTRTWHCTWAASSGPDTR